MTVIRRGWIHLAAGAGVGRILGFASNLLLSRWLGPTDLGLFNLVTTTVQTSDTLVRCGGDYALNYELGGHSESTRTSHGVELVRGLVQLCSLMTAIICVAAGLWVGLFQGLFPIELATSQRFALAVLLILMIFCEGTSASAWEVLLVSHRTAPLSLRQGLFFPLRLLFAATGALFLGVLGAISGWVLAAFVQVIWLKILLGSLWKPLQILPFFGSSIRQLLKRGLPFYAANLLSSIIFYPLLLKVAYGSGLADLGFLRAGQILQQLFAFVPATLVPVLFLKLRSKSNYADQVLIMERPLRVIWLVLLQLLLLYCTFDRYIMPFLFGSGYESALQPTRILLITALFESLSQLIVQPLLASGKTFLYGFWQNGSALIAAFLGWLWIPIAGLSAYLIIRLLYVVGPLIGFGMPAMRQLQAPQKLLTLILASTSLLFLLTTQTLVQYTPAFMPLVFIAFFVVVSFIQREDLLMVNRHVNTG